MNNTYECMVLLDNREVRQGWDALKQSVTGMMAKHGAEIVSARLWGERPLAFPINQQQRGTYLLVYFESETASVSPINRELNMAESVMRHVVTACDEVPESAHEPEAAFDVSAIGREPEVVDSRRTPLAETAEVAPAAADADKTAKTAVKTAVKTTDEPAESAAVEPTGEAE